MNRCLCYNNIKNRINRKLVLRKNCSVTFFVIYPDAFESSWKLVTMYHCRIINTFITPFKILETLINL